MSSRTSRQSFIHRHHHRRQHSLEIRRLFGRCISSLFLSVLFFSVFGVGQLQAEETTFLESLTRQARESGLHNDRYWHTLLHYKKGLLATRSLVDDPKFFLAPDGKYNPEAELAATIRALFAAESAGGKPALCTFVARYEWIKEKLNIDASRLPATDCTRFTEPIKPFEQFMADMKPASVTLVFPDAHINSPASMFGHTLLAIETESKSRLLAYAVNYAAATQETSGPIFAARGIFGSYRGYFSTLPYYGKIQEYSDIDRRDIWEYPLNLDKAETRRLLMHLYELDHIYSDYFFFDENCSYNLLFLLDAARPSLNITDDLGLWVIPLDTIKAVNKKEIIREALYRPSQTSKIQFLASLLKKADQHKAFSLARGELTADSAWKGETSADVKRRIDDLAIESLQYLYIKKEMPKEQYLDNFMKLLRARSTLGGGPESEKLTIPVPPRPDQGHHSGRIGFAAGSKGDKSFAEIQYRPVYHGLMDNTKGYHEGAQIKFAETTFRYYSQDNRLKLESLDAIDIVSIAPRDIFFKPVSWKVSTGLIQRIMADGEDHMVARLNPGGGLAWKNSLLGLSYVMMELDLNVGGAFRENYALGTGASLGFIKDIAGFWKVHLYARDIYYGLGDEHNTLEAGFRQNFVLNTNSSISLDITRRRTRDFYQTEFRGSVNLFF